MVCPASCKKFCTELLLNVFPTPQTVTTTHRRCFDARSGIIVSIHFYCLQKHPSTSSPVQIGRQGDSGNFSIRFRCLSYRRKTTPSDNCYIRTFIYSFIVSLSNCPSLSISSLERSCSLSKRAAVDAMVRHSCTSDTFYAL